VNNVEIQRAVAQTQFAETLRKIAKLAQPNLLNLNMFFLAKILKPSLFALGNSPTRPDPIILLLCTNAPDNHAVTYRDIERTDRGEYRLLR